jgi:hypothetical protein
MSAAAVARAGDLARRGHTQEGIAEILRAEGLADVSGVAAGNAARRSGDGLVRPQRGGKPGPAGGVPSVAAVPAAPALTPDDVAALAADIASEPDDLEHLRRRAREVRGLANGAHAAAEQEPRLSPVYAGLVRLEGDVTERIMRLTPRPPPDPATDPSYIEARRELVQRFEGLVKRLAAGAAAT